MKGLLKKGLTNFVLAVSLIFSIKANADKVSLNTNAGKIELEFFEKGVVKVNIIAPGIDSEFDPGLAVAGNLKPIQSQHNSSQNEISSLYGKIKYATEPLHLSFYDKTDRVLLQMDQAITSADDGSYYISFRKQSGDRYFGLGEMFPDYGWKFWKTTPLKLDQNGKKRLVWNQHLPPSELTLPFVLNPRGYGILIDNAFKAEFDFSQKNSFSYSAKGGPLRFYVFIGDSTNQILDAYSQLTGRAPIPPRWVTGYMQSRYGYKGEKNFRWLMDNFRSRNLPCDVLIFDLEWYFAGEKTQDINMGELAWSTERFKDPLAFQKEMQDRGFKTIVIIQPYFTSKSQNFEEVKKYSAKNQQGEPYVFSGLWGSIPKNLLIDFTNPDAQKWYAQKLYQLHQTGVDGWWTDLNEPEMDFPEMVFYGGKTRDAVHNLMALSSHKAIYQMYRAQLPDERVFIISRSGFVGDWRYGAGIWSGDVTSSWAHLTRNVQMGLSASLSGYSLWASDVGGFHGTPSAELYTRWMQFGAFCPIFRAHGNHSIREPWSFGEQTEKYMRELLNLRYQLSPYLYTLFREAYDTGKPVMRAMFLEFPNDEKAYEVSDQYMYGQNFLVAPVTLPGARFRAVYLPAGTWTNFWTEEQIKGPKKILVSAPLNQIPLFVREGAIVPMAPVMQYTGEKPLDPLFLHIYPGSSSSLYQVYDDDGSSYRYEQGEFSFLPVKFTPGLESILKVGPRQGKFSGMHNSSFEIIIHNQKKPAKIILDGQEIAESKSGSGKEPFWNYDSGKKLLKIFIPAKEEFTLNIK